MAGATAVTELLPNAWGDRGSRIRDPLGTRWWIQTQVAVEDLSDEGITRRWREQAHIDGMHIAHETLDRELRGRIRQPPA